MAKRSVLLPAILVLLAACNGDDEAPKEVSAEDLLVRQRAAAHFAEDELPRALELIGGLADREGAALEDLVHAAAVALDPKLSQVDRARGWIERAAETAPDDLRVLWAQHRIASYDGDWQRSEELLRQVLRAAPDDVPAKLALADVLLNWHEDATDEVIGLYEDILAVGPDFGGSWYVTTTYRMGRILIETGRDAEAEAYFAEEKRLKDQGMEAAKSADVDVGTFGSFAPPAPHEEYPRPDADLAGLPPATWRWGDAQEQAGVLAGARGIQAILPSFRLTPQDDSLRAADERLGVTLSWVFPQALGAEELVVWGAGGLAIARWDGGAWRLDELLDEPVHAAAAFDLGDADHAYLDHPAHAGDGDVDVVAATAEGLVLLERGESGFERRAEPLFTYTAPPRAIVPVDYDHEGDVDLLLAGPGGATLLRNDGAHAGGGAFTDATAESGIPRGSDLTWAAVEDLDHDNDVDLLYGGPGGVHHASNERAGRFSDASAKLPRGLASGARAGDVDGDGWADLVTADGTAWLGAPGGAWREGGKGVRPPGPALLPRESVDATGDAPFGAVVCDKEGDGAPDLVALAGDALVTRAATEEPGASTLRLLLHGEQDNHRGLGATVEVILGAAYRRVYWRGGTLAIATHGRPSIDVLRVTWPNGVVQSVVDAPARGDVTVKQRKGLAGSCPFLYTWDGERFTFVTDVLGITPLGLPMAPGMMVPPDHDEYVLVRGDQLRPQDGEYVLQITEELREVTYLDRVRLDVIDHPAGVEVFPNERFSFPPFPEAHVHTLRGALAPEVATGSDGRDWAAALRADDEELAYPFRALGGQFAGLAEPWFVELEFDADAVRDAAKLRLALNGWLFWTNASVNVAAARHPTVEFVPPLLMVPDGAGGWREAGVLGFPAGKLKTMVVDVTDQVPRDDPRIRVFSTLQLYWDSIRLAVDADDAPLVTTSIEPASAELWLRGFSRPLPHSGHPELETFDWDALDEPRWNQHPGTYTRLGDSLELITAIDDRFAILGAGDALTVRFPADGLPPLSEGWERDYLVFFDGWAKDRDPNTLEALYVEPLPFHGMSGYPYDEPFPDTPEHRAWRREWATRPATTWIEPLVR
jgi:hypothetical protein